MREDWIIWIFKRIHRRYGYKRFWDTYINPGLLAEAKRDWAVELGPTLTRDRIKSALELCFRDLSWPPNPAEFLQRAKPGPAAHQPHRPPPARAVDRDAGTKECRSLQDILAGYQPGQLTAEHRIMLQNHNPELLTRIDAKRPPGDF